MRKEADETIGLEKEENDGEGGERMMMVGYEKEMRDRGRAK
jgi:hypothetical protein